MSTESIIASVLVFGAVISVFVAFRSLLPETKEEDNNKNIPLLFRMCDTGIVFCATMAGSILADLFAKKTKNLRKVLRRADLPLEVEYVWGAVLFFALIGAAVTFILVLTAKMSIALIGFLGVCFIICGILYPFMVVSKAAAAREDEIMQHLPFAIDLISSSMNAGLDFGAAVRYFLATGGKDVLRKEFTTFLREVELGKNRTEALRDMQGRVCLVEFSRFVAAISHGMESGSSIIEIMGIQAEEMRRVKYARAEQQAAKAPIKMIIPMALFILPSMFIMIGTAVLLRVKESGVFSMLGK